MFGEFRSQPWNSPTSPPIANKRSSSLFEPFLFFFFEAVPFFLSGKRKGGNLPCETGPWNYAPASKKVFHCSSPFWGRDRRTTSPCLLACQVCRFRCSENPFPASLARPFEDLPNIFCHNSRIFIFNSIKKGKQMGNRHSRKKCWFPYFPYTSISKSHGRGGWRVVGWRWPKKSFPSWFERSMLRCLCPPKLLQHCSCWPGPRKGGGEGMPDQLWFLHKIRI